SSAYSEMMKTVAQGLPMNRKLADEVADAMMKWALDNGATHFTHWFQPMTGVTAEKHDALYEPTSDGKALHYFSGKALIMGEPDASSFPSGGLRATFEARGYTAWDYTSHAFLKTDASGVTLCIPSVFYSYTGEALDKKTPLLRSMEAVSRQAIRVLRHLGNKSSQKVVSTVGPEQEYFLIDRELFLQRTDLIHAGRTLFGARPAKGQEMEDHYFGAIKERIAVFMRELDEELWRMGVSSKTKHNEVAPAQHELAPIFATANIASDHNQLVMETMKKVALRHDLVCLLHEKPFAGINGSGKHNNWSISTDDGINLLDPGHTPHDNVQFLVFLVAVIKAVDEYADLMRVAAANPGNDHRLGANEAPPAIISIFLGEQLTDILDQIEQGKLHSTKTGGEIALGTSALSSLPRDNTDRNRTSPFAFTGNKFEFRMVPSSSSISAPSFTTNTIVADALSEIADRLDNASDKSKEIDSILNEFVKKHRRVIFNGNNYSDEWVKEAESRGLPNIKNTVDAANAIIAEKNVKMYEKHSVLSKIELHARYAIVLESYSKTINIEGESALEMAKRQILPACIDFTSILAESINNIKNTGTGADTSVHEDLLKKVSGLITSLYKKIEVLENALKEAQGMEDEDHLKTAAFYRDSVFTAMNSLREDADALEVIVDRDIWPFPTYGDLLYKV
ncbi:MAG: glutamine synthetase III, partial [Spirochaetia bacterium]|nr:glutamine synthetase III [Spirochaetia bacterium]